MDVRRKKKKKKLHASLGHVCVWQINGVCCSADAAVVQKMCPSSGGERGCRSTWCWRWPAAPRETGNTGRWCAGCNKTKRNRLGDGAQEKRVEDDADMKTDDEKSERRSRPDEWRTRSLKQNWTLVSRQLQSVRQLQLPRGRKRAMMLPTGPHAPLQGHGAGTKPVQQRNYELKEFLH